MPCRNEPAVVLAKYLIDGYPDKDRETVVVTHRKPLLQHLIEFAIHRNGYIRATYISKSEFGSLVSGVKFYRKLHPKEK